MKKISFYSWQSLILLPALFLTACFHSGQPLPSFRQDLRPFGLPTEANGQIVASFSDLAFLSGDLLLVTVNSKTYGPVEPLLDDQPPSKLLLFDLSRKRLWKTAVMPVEKSAGSVRAIAEGRFVVLNESGLNVCSHDLECRSALKTPGPMLVSPKGTRIAIGGNGMSEQRLLDGTNLAEIDRFPWKGPHVIPGDTSLILQADNKSYVKAAGQPDQVLPFQGSWLLPQAWFVSDTRAAGFESNKVLGVAETTGATVYRLPVTQRWHLAEVATSASGSRFCFHESGYTLLNSIVNFLDIDSGRPHNVETVDVVSVESGKSLLKLEWDPRPYVGMSSTPALSPNGKRLAVIRSGMVEVFDIP